MFLFVIEKVIVLTMDHLQGAFSILSVGVCASVGLFLGELLAFYLCLPCAKKHSKGSSGYGKSHNSKKLRKKKRSKRDKERKQKSELELILAWNEINLQQDMGFTPLKRKVIHK